MLSLRSVLSLFASDVLCDLDMMLTLCLLYIRSFPQVPSLVSDVPGVASGCNGGGVRMEALPPKRYVMNG